MDRKIYYREGYKYQLAKDYAVQTELYGYHIKTKFIELYESGILIIKAGYAWDGPSGPTIDTKNTLRCSLVHDALYQLLREGHFTKKLHEKIREYADKLLKDIGIEDGMSWLRAELWEEAVNLFAYKSSTVEGKRKMLTAGADA